MLHSFSLSADAGKVGQTWPACAFYCNSTPQFHHLFSIYAFGIDLLLKGGMVKCAGRNQGCKSSILRNLVECNLGNNTGVKPSLYRPFTRTRTLYWYSRASTGSCVCRKSRTTFTIYEDHHYELSCKFLNGALEGIVLCKSPTIS